MLNLFVDDMRSGPSNLFGVAQKGWENWVVVRGIHNAQELLSRGMVDNLSLDCHMGSDSETGEMNKNGMFLVKWMMRTKSWPKGSIAVHSSDDTMAQEIRDFIVKWRK